MNAALGPLEILGDLGLANPMLHIPHPKKTAFSPLCHLARLSPNKVINERRRWKRRAQQLGSPSPTKATLSRNCEESSISSPSNPNSQRCQKEEVSNALDFGHENIEQVSVARLPRRKL